MGTELLTYHVLTAGVGGKARLGGNALKGMAPRVAQQFTTLSRLAPTSAQAMPWFFAGVTAERARQEQIAMGREEGNDLTGVAVATGKGAMAYVLGNYTVVNRLQGWAGVIQQNFGAATTREFAKESLKHLAKTTAFDAVLNMGQTSMEMFMDYVTGVNEEALDNWFGAIS